MSADLIVKVLLATLGVVSAVVSVIGFLCREFVKYLFARIAVLEGRETTLLAGAVKAIEKIGEEQDTQGALVREIAKTAERERWLRERGGQP